MTPTVRTTPAKVSTVSIAMCTYNGAQYLRRQLETIINQTYPIHEILIFDDCSEDNTVEIIQEFMSIDSRIKLTVNAVNLGFTQNFEQAVKAATGDVIAIADQDDIWMEQKIERMMMAWKPDHPLIYCMSYLFSGDAPDNPMIDARFRRFEGDDARKIFMFNIISGHASLFKRSFLELVLPFRDGIMYDWWMGIVAAYNGGVQYLPEILVLQRMHSNNVTVENKLTTKERRNRYKNFIIPHALAFTKAPGIPVQDKKMLEDFARHMETSLHKKFHWPLFNFILRYRKLLFFYKKRSIGIISHVKYGILYAWQQ